MERQRKRTVGWLLVGVLLGPPVLLSIYLGLSRWPSRWFTESSDWAALLLSIGMGVICLVRLPMSEVVRVVLVLVYVPVAGFTLVMYCLLFVGYMFGDWL